MDPLRKVCKKDSRYRLEAYTFLFEALEKTVQATVRDEGDGTSRHISGQELLEGMRVYASRTFGPLAAQVWRAWGVKTTFDWGCIVFNLVEGEMLRRQESDSIDDFRDVYDFDEVFVSSYVPALPTELGSVPKPPLEDCHGDDPGAI